MKLYFAYGSNMNVDQFDGRCPKSTPESGATLRGYRLIINQRGVATLAKNKKAEVEGALYNLDPKDELVLDVCEGVAGGFYKKETLSVTLDNGDKVEALVYIDHKGKAGGRARKGYLETCLDGAVEWGLTKAVNTLKHIKKTQPKPRPVKVKDQLIQWTPQRGLALQAKASRKKRRVVIDKSRNTVYTAAKRDWKVNRKTRDRVCNEY
ncbi:MAG: gamma-glutamylcyclotransferase [Myxococcales bacterium]|nr:gamma-glutamylcyclotransferase [Myxococcales bacterium]